MLGGVLILAGVALVRLDELRATRGPAPALPQAPVPAPRYRQVEPAELMPARR